MFQTEDSMCEGLTQTESFRSLKTRAARCGWAASAGTGAGDGHTHSRFRFSGAEALAVWEAVTNEGSGGL